MQDEDVVIELVESGLVDVEIGQDGSVHVTPTVRGQRALAGEDEDDETDGDLVEV